MDPEVLERLLKRNNSHLFDAIVKMAVMMNTSMYLSCSLGEVLQQ